jgi:hypothetical protein
MTIFPEESFSSTNFLISSKDQILLPGTPLSSPAEYQRLLAKPQGRNAGRNQVVRPGAGAEEAQIYLNPSAAGRAALRISGGTAVVMSRRVAMLVIRNMVSYVGAEWRLAALSYESYKRLDNILLVI